MCSGIVCVIHLFRWLGWRAAIDHSSVPRAHVQAIGRMLQSNTVLEKLYLWGNNIGDDGVMVLAAGLRHNTALEELYLNNNHEKIGDLACKYLGAYTQSANLDI